MPIYAYKCESCGHTKDVLQKMSDPLLTDCPQCGAPSFKKQLTAAGFQLKGSGWYVTDFRGGDSGAAAPAKDAGAPAATAESTSTSSPAPASAPAAAAPAASLPAASPAPAASSPSPGKPA